jgi:pimeloyl-ACP methyl ester carboxylesterase
MRLPVACLRFMFIVATGYSAVAAPQNSALDASQPAHSGPSQPAIIVGFLGGFVRHDDLYHPEVQLAARLRSTYNDAVAVKIFENRHKREAHRTISRLLDRNGDGLLSADEKRNARIILFGHSWGASAAIALAGDLQRDSIPVLLTVQVDSIAKMGQNDAVIPANVARAINFYQPHGLFHGRARITAADPSRTQVMGDVQLEYRNKRVECRNYPWYDRLLFKDHIKIECDADVWSQVEALIHRELAAEPVSEYPITSTDRVSD